MQHVSVLIHLPGSSEIRVVVPPFEPSDDGPESDALYVLAQLSKTPVANLRVSILSTQEITEAN